jgi:hypothetical protein
MIPLFRHCEGTPEAIQKDGLLREYPRNDGGARNDTESTTRSIPCARYSPS